jgi:hypothetical protein
LKNDDSGAHLPPQAGFLLGGPAIGIRPQHEHDLQHVIGDFIVIVDCFVFKNALSPEVSGAAKDSPCSAATVDAPSAELDTLLRPLALRVIPRPQ